MSYLLASPTIDPVDLVSDLDALLIRIGRGPSTLLYTNALGIGKHAHFPAFRGQLEAIGFTLIKDDIGEFQTNHGPTGLRRLRYAAFRSAGTRYSGAKMNLPTYDELRRDSDQLDVLEHPLDKPLFVAGPPGSGKTVLAVKRAQMLAAQRTPATLITYNRMLRRLAALLSDGAISARTMHSFVWRDYRDRAMVEPPKSGQSSFDYEWEEMLATLTGCEPLPTEDHLIIDEGQDLPEGFFRYACHVASVLTVLQMTTRRLGDRRTTLEQIKTAGDLPNPRLLRMNHRNAPEIARVAEHFHAGRLPAATVKRSRDRHSAALGSNGRAAGDCWR